MKVKIESEGRADNTKVFNVETGEVINNISSIMWECSARTNRASSVLKMSFTPGEMTGEEKVVCNELIELIASFIEDFNIQELADIQKDRDILKHVAQSIRAEFID